jgi:glutathione-regulated potassium-efflux system ancillary protein KefC/glutathione-regulated potassium-efflux system protein KefB
MISLAQTAILLAAAVIAVSLFRFVRLSSILGYVVAGLVIGPWGLNLIGAVTNIMHVSEFGIVLLLFIIGLELQPTRLWVMRRIVFGLGAAQVALCSVLLGALAWSLGQPPAAAAIIGFGLSLSSTPLVLQVLAERNQLKTQWGRNAFGVLLFQDIAVLPVLALLPLLSPLAVEHPDGSAWLTLLKLIAVVAIAILLGGRLLLRPALRLVARVQVSEVFTAAALLVVIGTTLLTNLAGLSASLGAFIAGVLLADSEFRHELEADLEPFKGLLLGLFFVSVGMTANLGLFRSEPLALLAVTVAFLAIKVGAVSALGRLSGLKPDAARRLGFVLPEGGEFAFVLFTQAARERIFAQSTADLLVLAVTLSMMLGPLLLIAYEALAKRWLAPPAAPFDAIEEQDTPVIIAGFGRFGQIVARVLRVKGLPFTALDISQTHVDFVRRIGSNKVYYGDASRLDLLRAAGAASAQVLVLAVDDVDASVRIAALVREQFPKIKIFARARNRQHAFALMDLGVKQVIRETYASSLEMAGSVLEALGQSPAAAREAVRRFRTHDEATLAAQYAVKEDQVKFIATTREAAQQLERLFEADAARPPPE